MGMEYIMIFFFLIISVVVTMSAWYINDFNSEGVFYGVRVPRDYRENEGIKKATTSFRKNIVTSNFLIFTMFIVIFSFITKIYLMVIFILLLSVAQIICYGKANKRVIELKKELKWNEQSRENKVYVEIGGKKEKENKLYIYLFGISLAFALFGLILLCAKFSTLPDLVPVHFANGVADRYADTRTIFGKFEVAMIPLINLILVVSMFIYTKNYGKKITSGRLNGGFLSEIKNRRNISKNIMNNLMAGVTLAVSALMIVGELTIFEIIDYNQIMENYLNGVAIFLIGIPVLYMIVASRQEKKKASCNKEEEEIYIDDDKYYIFGMFYYNEKDSNVMIVRRVGLGADFNYATLVGKIIGVLNLVLVIGVVIFLFFTEI